MFGVVLFSALLVLVNGFSITELPYVRQSGFQDVVFRNSRVGTTEFLVLTVSHGNPARGIIKFPSEIQGGGWKLAVYGGDDDKSAEIYHRIVTNANKDSLGRIDSKNGAASLTMVVFEEKLIPGNTNGAIIENESVKLKVQGTGQFLFVFGSDNRGTSDIADFSIKLKTDDPSFFFLVRNGDFRDSSLGNRRGAISGIQLLPESGVPTTPPPVPAPTPQPPALSPKQITISASDDVEEAETGRVLLASSDLELTFDSREGQGNQIVGVQFDKVQIPKESTIVSARIRFECDEADSGPSPKLLIAAHDTANSASFAKEDFDVSRRPKTNEIAWNNLPECTVGKTFRSPELRDIVQSIVKKSNWSPGNRISFMIRNGGQPGDTNKRTATAKEGAKAPILEVQFVPTIVTTFLTTADVEEGESGFIYADSSDLELTFDAHIDQGNQVVGIQFDDVGIPQGSVIASARLKFICDEPGTGDSPTLLISGHNSGNSALFTDQAFDVSTRPKTIEIFWNDLGDCVIDKEVRSPQLRSIVQSIVSKSSWTPGNRMTLIIRKSGTGSTKRTFGSTESGNAPVLEVEYGDSSLSLEEEGSENFSNEGDNGGIRPAIPVAISAVALVALGIAVYVAKRKSKDKQQISINPIFANNNKTY